MSTALFYDSDTDQITCHYGPVTTIETGWTHGGRKQDDGTWTTAVEIKPVTGISPIILTAPKQAGGWDSIIHFFAQAGAAITVANGCLYLTTPDGSWVWRLEPAHWADPANRPKQWARDGLLIGRWPD